MPITRYSKFLTALAGVATTAAAFLADGELSQNDVIGICSALLAAFGVYAVKNSEA